MANYTVIWFSNVCTGVYSNIWSDNEWRLIIRQMQMKLQVIYQCTVATRLIGLTHIAIVYSNSPLLIHVQFRYNFY